MKILDSQDALGRTDICFTEVQEENASISACSQSILLYHSLLGYESSSQKHFRVYIYLYSNHCLSIMFFLFTVIGSDSPDLLFWRQNDASSVSQTLSISVCWSHWSAVALTVPPLHKTWGNWIICSVVLDAYFPTFNSHNPHGGQLPSTSMCYLVCFCEK